MRIEDDAVGCLTMSPMERREIESGELSGRTFLWVVVALIPDV